MSPRIVLIGPPGSGKSTVGRLLADALDVTFRDTDADVEAIEERPISDIFVDDGEPYFRRAERAVVQRALAEHDGVLALGGGAILDPDTQADLADHTVVFLSVGLADAAGRVGLTTSRPLLLGSPRRQWQELMDARRAIYEQLATVIVATDGLTPEQVRDGILAEVPV